MPPAPARGQGAQCAKRVQQLQQPRALAREQQRPLQLSTRWSYSHPTSRPPRAPPTDAPRRWTATRTPKAPGQSVQPRRHGRQDPGEDGHHSRAITLCRTRWTARQGRVRGGGTVLASPPPVPQWLGAAPTQLGQARGRCPQRVQPEAFSTLETSVSIRRRAERDLR